MVEPGIYPNRLAVKPKQENAATVGGGERALNWDERKDPVKFEFGDGAELTGVLLAADRVSVRDAKTGIGKPAMRYTVKEQDADEPCFFFGTHQLDQKLRACDVGHYVSIRCEGEDKSVSRNGNAMKVFKVMVSKEIAPGFANDGSPITDDDLPPASAY